MFVTELAHPAAELGLRADIAQVDQDLDGSVVFSGLLRGHKGGNPPPDTLAFSAQCGQASLPCSCHGTLTFNDSRIPPGPLCGQPGVTADLRGGLQLPDLPPTLLRHGRARLAQAHGPQVRVVARQQFDQQRIALYRREARDPGIDVRTAWKSRLTTLGRCGDQVSVKPQELGQRRL
jgi:hypothetical protein